MVLFLLYRTKVLSFGNMSGRIDENELKTRTGEGGNRI
jgi:hypothetical protein